MKIVQYHDICQHIQSGDVIAFAGDDLLSGVVRLSTKSSVSHVGIAWVQDQFSENQPPKNDADQPSTPRAIGSIDLINVDIIEAHPLYFDREARTVKTGVQRNSLNKLIDHYRGQIWWLPLSPTKRQDFNFQKFIAFILENEQRAYDFVQAALAGLDLLDHWGLTQTQEDYSKFFCSELVAAAFKTAGIIEQMNASEITPIDLCRLPIYAEDYYLLCGEAIPIAGYNSRSDENLDWD